MSTTSPFCLVYGPEGRVRQLFRLGTMCLVEKPGLLRSREERMDRQVAVSVTASIAFPGNQVTKGFVHYDIKTPNPPAVEASPVCAREPGEGSSRVVCLSFAPLALHETAKGSPEGKRGRGQKFHLYLHSYSLALGFSVRSRFQTWCFPDGCFCGVFRDP